MLVVDSIVGDHNDAALHDRLHALEDHGQLEVIQLDENDAQRHRLRVTTDHGTDVAIVLARDQFLCDGAVLLLEDARAIVVRFDTTDWCRFLPADVAAALELGHRAGHLHWRVRFDGEVLEVAALGAREPIYDRVEDLIAANRLRVM